jgi:hypothetical protein
MAVAVSVSSDDSIIFDLHPDDEACESDDGRTPMEQQPLAAPSPCYMLKPGSVDKNNVAARLFATIKRFWKSKWVWFNDADNLCYSDAPSRGAERTIVIADVVVVMAVNRGTMLKAGADADAVDCGWGLRTNDNRDFIWACRSAAVRDQWVAYLLQRMTHLSPGRREEFMRELAYGDRLRRTATDTFDTRARSWTASVSRHESALDFSPGGRERPSAGRGNFPGRSPEQSSQQFWDAPEPASDVMAANQDVAAAIASANTASTNMPTLKRRLSMRRQAPPVMKQIDPKSFEAALLRKKQEVSFDKILRSSYDEVDTSCFVTTRLGVGCDFGDLGRNVAHATFLSPIEESGRGIVHAPKQGGGGGGGGGGDDDDDESESDGPPPDLEDAARRAEHMLTGVADLVSAIDALDMPAEPGAAPRVSFSGHDRGRGKGFALVDTDGLLVKRDGGIDRATAAAMANVANASVLLAPGAHDALVSIVVETSHRKVSSVDALPAMGGTTWNMFFVQVQHLKR